MDYVTCPPAIAVVGADRQCNGRDVVLTSCAANDERRSTAGPYPKVTAERATALVQGLIGRRSVDVGAHGTSDA
jgi:hypothetical protein